MKWSIEKPVKKWIICLCFGSENSEMGNRSENSQTLSIFLFSHLASLVFSTSPFLSFRTEHNSATIRLYILRRRRKKKRTDVALLVSLLSYYCLSTLQSEKTVQTSSEPTFEKSLSSAVYRPLGEKWISFPCFTEHMSFLSGHTISSEYHLEALKDRLSDLWSDVHLKWPHRGYIFHKENNLEIKEYLLVNTSQ